MLLYVGFPSCNVSWEDWFEGCIELGGGITSTLFDFWTRFWGVEGGGMSLPSSLSGDSSVTSRRDSGETNLRGPAVPPRVSPDLLRQIDLPSSTTQTLLLPSPHHRNPRFRFSSTVQPPPTPLNVFVLTLIASAASSIWIQTPNLTCGPVIVSIYHFYHIQISYPVYSIPPGLPTYSKDAKVKRRR